MNRRDCEIRFGITIPSEIAEFIDANAGEIHGQSKSDALNDQGIGVVSYRAILDLNYINPWVQLRFIPFILSSCGNSIGLYFPTGSANCIIACHLLNEARLIPFKGTIKDFFSDPEKLDPDYIFEVKTQSFKNQNPIFTYLINESSSFESVLHKTPLALNRDLFEYRCAKFNEEDLSFLDELEDEEDYEDDDDFDYDFSDEDDDEEDVENIEEEEDEETIAERIKECMASAVELFDQVLTNENKRLGSVKVRFENLIDREFWLHVIDKYKNQFSTRELFTAYENLLEIQFVGPYYGHFDKSLSGESQRYKEILEIYDRMLHLLPELNCKLDEIYLRHNRKQIIEWISES